MKRFAPVGFLALLPLACGGSGASSGPLNAEGGTGGTGGSLEAGTQGNTSGSSSGSGGTGGSSSSGSGNTSGSSGGSGTDGGSGNDGSSPTTGTDGGGSSLPWLSVSGNVIKDSTGATVILRGVAIPDIGNLDSAAGGPTGVADRIDEVLSTSSPSLDSHVVRLPVYPETCFNGGSPYYSPEPFPVGTPAPAGKTVTLLSATDYINNVLKPAVDYAASKNLYAIIDFHQIDDVTSGSNNSSAAAVTFWTTVAPAFSSYSNVIFEAFNEPIDSTLNGWNAAFQTAAQSWVTAIRAGAPNNLIVVGSPDWSQHPEGAVTYPLTGGNLVFTAHIYPGNFPGTNNAFQNNVTTAIAHVPVFITEWGYQIGTASRYNNLLTPNDTWAQNLQSFVNGNGASWTAWVADPSWGPPMFTMSGGLTDFGTFVQGWLANP